MHFLRTLKWTPARKVTAGVGCFVLVAARVRQRHSTLMSWRVLRLHFANLLALLHIYKYIYIYIYIERERERHVKAASLASSLGLCSPMTTSV
jgi:hypothetical protein